MALDSITRPMKLSEEGCLRLIEAMNEPVEPLDDKTDLYEEGIKSLREFFNRKKLAEEN